jgi:hypothetical protein
MHPTPARLLALALTAFSLSVCAQSLVPPSAAVKLTPAQSAWVGAEIRRANDLFVKRVVAITNMPPDTVRQAIPPEGRITDPAARTVSAIEKFGGKPLADEQKVAIRSAEEDRRQMIASAREQAPNK